MNQPAFISIVWSLVSLFMGKKIRSRWGLLVWRISFFVVLGKLP